LSTTGSCIFVKELNYNERVTELARMLSGDEIDNEAIANAKKMIDI
jgi:DNA repair ATPase RecN